MEKTPFAQVYKHTIQMLRDRNYKLSKRSIEFFKDPWEILKDTNPSPGAIFAKKKVSNTSPKYKKVMVFFSADKFGVKPLRGKILEIHELQIDHVILILESKFTSHGQRHLDAYPDLEKEIFYYWEMLANPLAHNLVPKHELLSPEKCKEMILHAGPKLPCIKVKDRIARHYNAKIGQIFKIYRNHSLYYRCVTA